MALNKLQVSARVPNKYDGNLWAILIRQIEVFINALGDRRAVANTSALTAAPTVGDWGVGDFVPNSSPSELGIAGSKYVIIGWICTVAGTPGTWLQCRCLTGN